MTIKQICIFCGSGLGAMPEYVHAARQVGNMLASRNITLVYGGANVGTMGELSNAALNQGGKVIGVIPEYLVDKEVAHSGLSELHVVSSMHERKAMMAEISDAFIALPGGFGTIEEFFEVLTWAQLGMHTKPCGLLNVCRYFDKMIDFIGYIAEQQFIRTEHRSMILSDSIPESLLRKMEAYQPLKVDKFMNLKIA